jgi:hypothetical protein
MSTVYVQSDRKILIEVGFVRGSEEFKGTLQPGPNYQSVQLRPGLNVVDAKLAREWLRTNAKYLDCIKEHKIRIVDSPSQEMTA